MTSTYAAAIGEEGMRRVMHADAPFKGMLLHLASSQQDRGLQGSVSLMQKLV